MPDTTILGIETSCDETGAAVVRSGREILSNVVASQIATHQPYGGVVPELASREHLRAILPVVRQALAEARMDYESVDAIAVTQGPGLIGALLVGISFAKALAFALEKPLIAVNQLKLHETATVTLALKNIAMSFPAADYYGHPRSQQRHRQHFFDDMHSFIAAMAKRFPVHVAVTVGHPAMIGTGPLGGHAVETGLTIASTDALAADVVGAKLLGFTAQAVRHLWEAGRLGLGETDLEQMEFPALNMRQAIETFTAAAYGERLTFEHE